MTMGASAAAETHEQRVGSGQDQKEVDQEEYVSFNPQNTIKEKFA
jgi:hypothetical protein